MPLKRSRDTGFTIVELLVVIGIIAVLVSLLIPAISKVRDRARNTDTQQFLGQLQAAIESYQQDYKAYPGPLRDDELRSPSATIIPVGTFPPGYDDLVTPGRFTGSENLVLGLLGGLFFSVPDGGFIAYDPTKVGLGPSNLTAANPKRHEPFLDAANLSWRVNAANEKTGRFVDGAGFADDTLVPEFVDRFASPMPILYLRAKRGVQPITTALTDRNNSVITFGNDPPAVRAGTYDLAQILGYTGAYTGTEGSPALDNTVLVAGNASRSIGEDKRAPKYYNGTAQVGIPASNFPHGLRSVEPTKKMQKGADYQYPYDAFPYFQNPQSPNSARNKDSYILISAGIDRIYGTSDDVVNFGSVTE